MSVHIRLMTCLLITLGTLAPNAGAAAITQANHQRVRISIGGGLSKYDMSTINKYYIDDFANEFDIFDEHISSGQHALGEFEYFVAPKWSFGLGISYLFAQIKNQADSASYSLSASMWVPELRITHYITRTHIEIFVGSGLGYGFGGTELTGNEDLGAGAEQENRNVSYEFHAKGAGFQLFGGTSFRINRSMLFGFEVGYRYYNTGDLEDSAGVTWYVDFLYRDNPPIMKLELSGVFISGVLSFDL